MRTFNSIASLLWISASVRDCTALSITLHAIMVVYSVTIKCTCVASYVCDDVSGFCNTILGFSNLLSLVTCYTKCSFQACC